VKFSVRRLTALDMHGATGGPVRRRVVTAEFFAVLALALVLGPLLAARRAPWPWLIEIAGAGLNYVPLAIHAVRFSRSGAVERELAGVEIRSAFRRYGAANLLLFVPGLIFALALMPGEWRPVPAKAP
jgi:hypothetical protein